MPLFFAISLWIHQNFHKLFAFLSDHFYLISLLLCHQHFNELFAFLSDHLYPISYRLHHQDFHELFVFFSDHLQATSLLFYFVIKIFTNPFQSFLRYYFCFCFIFQIFIIAWKKLVYEKNEIILFFPALHSSFAYFLFGFIIEIFMNCFLFWLLT